MDLQEILPGLLPPAQGQNQIRVYQDLNNRALEPLVSARRLGSPQHYRYYFAFSQPSGAVSDVEVTQFIETAIRSPEDALLLFSTMSGVARPQGGNAAEVLVGRLAAIADKIPAAAIGGIIRAFAETLDAPEFSQTVGDFDVRLTWQVANRVVELLLPRTSTEAIRGELERRDETQASLVYAPDRGLP